MRLSDPARTVKPRAPSANGHAGYQPAWIDSAAFSAATYRRDPLIRGILYRGQPCVWAGPKKSLKTSTLIDAAISLASGTPFLGEFAAGPPVRVALISGESGEAAIQDCARRVALARSVQLPDLADRLLWGFQLPALSNPSHLAALRQTIIDHGIEVLIIDPLYLCLMAGSPAGGLSAANLYDMGPLLSNIATACLSAGCTPILAHHYRITRANPYAEPLLDDLAYAGIQEYARQWVLLGRRSPYDPDDLDGRHELWLSAGGSAGHALVRAVDICEGRARDDLGGRRWEVAVQPASTARAAGSTARKVQQSQRRAAEDKTDEATVLRIVDQLSSAGAPASRTKLQERAGISARRVASALARLIDEGILVEVEGKATIGNGAVRTAICYRRPS